MQNLKLSIQEAQEMLLMSQSSVYAWIDKGKLQTVDGPGGKVIIISNQEASQIRELNLKSKRNKTSKQLGGSANTTNAIYNNLQENSENTTENLFDEQTSTLTSRLITELKELAFEAGKYKQLEIIRNEEKENAKYWETKFFEANHALIEKNYEISALKLQVTELQKEIEQQRAKKKWFNF